MIQGPLSQANRGNWNQSFYELNEISNKELAEIPVVANYQATLLMTYAQVGAFM